MFVGDSKSVNFCIRFRQGVNLWIERMGCAMLPESDRSLLKPVIYLEFFNLR